LTAQKKNSVSCKSRLRILSGDLIALGPGKVDLLESIGTEGSISQAARERHLSYRRAWNMVDTMNKCFKEPLVISVTGGKGGGGAELSPAGKKVIKLYREMENKANAAIQTEWKTLQKLLPTRRGANEQ
jgi:molybdate transport system regulatory protein